MEDVRPHDLLRINDNSDLISYTPVPEWVEQSLDKASYVVVRRVTSKEGLIAVGVRGSVRSERFAAFLPIENIIERITPEQLAKKRKWEGQTSELFFALGTISEVMNHYGLSWGPVGSVGFELASGVSTVTKQSDIDLIIRDHEGLNQSLAQALLDLFTTLPFRVDAQVEMEEGAFSLSEFAFPTGQHILLRTMNGPLLKKI
ncbi:MAG TPA: malonate decarboxylase holo-ACP synthase [Metabacillus sp.]|nr:malonate decarboxylase holo-ACP synthase [Metabacillus sp.]